ncbi:MAG TPA: ERCC4 domain-containing protein, partial [Natronoarchaeum rubrum]|nr:ERCC4 domain-containing protein [Natronoarchaeum rubrum]
IEDRLEKLNELGVTNKRSADLSENDLQSMRAELQKLMNNDQSEGYQGMSVHAEIRKLRTAVTYVETQSVEALERYFERLRNAARSSGASKADQRLVSDPRVRTAMQDCASYDDLHPKFSRARVLLAQTLGIEDGERVIVFTESRDTAEILTEFLSESFDARRFVGQGDREGSDGMTQNEQQETLDDFRSGEFEVLVSTSVAEEGLDVPEVDLVLFYEPVPTAIRSIQRKGRTGRQAEGRVVVLLAEDTRDEAYFWISRRREQQMEDELRELKGLTDEIEEELDDSQQQLGDFDSGSGSGSSSSGESAADGGESDVQPGLADFTGADEDASSNETDGDDAAASDGDDASTAASGDQEDDADDGDADATAASSSDDDATVATAEPDDDGTIEIVADQRELDANIARELSKREDVQTRLETLEVGDYVLSDRVAVERKAVDDFLDTLTGGDRSLFEQVGDMSRHYSRPVVVLEGEGLYEKRDVHPNAIRGALSSLVVDFGVSVLRTEDEDDTRELLAVIAGREQENEDREVSIHGEKQSKTLSEQQEYVVASIADVGPVTARSLLSEFGTVEAVMTARKEDLLEAEGVGEVTADRIREVVGSEYEE